MKNRFYVIFYLISAFLIAGLIGGITYAWFINAKKTESVDVSTNGIVLSYTINDEDDVNTLEYTLDNISFFDVDSEHEGKYFTTMAVVIQLNLENHSKKDVDITVSTGNNSANSPYVEAVVTNEEIDSSTYNKSVLDYLSDNSLTNSYTIKNVVSQETAVVDASVVYLYVYGVQPDDDATNDFLSETYNLTINIKADLSK
ncbi:MAG: hypothetical protein ACI35W_07210 [Anaeroplasmataceae bacterium]